MTLRCGMVERMSSKRVYERKRDLDRLLDEPDIEGETTAQERAVAEEAIRNFKSGGAELLDTATPFLWAYYRSVVSVFTAAERDDYGIPEIPQSADIWEQVEFRLPPALTFGGNRLEPGRSYISFEGEVSWEPEHGLQLVFEHGLRVCKVGPYDGHCTNAHAYADGSLLGVVFKS
jgi:hypothetical protein